MKANEVDWQVLRLRQRGKKMYTGLIDLPGGFQWVVRNLTLFEKLKDFFINEGVLELKNAEGVTLDKELLLDAGLISIELAAERILTRMTEKQILNSGSTSSLGFTIL